MPALHTAALVSAGLLVIAIAVILWRLPAKAEAVAWAGSGPGSAPAGDQDAESRVHTVDEVSNDLPDVDSAPLAARARLNTHGSAGTPRRIRTMTAPPGTAIPHRWAGTRPRPGTDHAGRG